MKLRFKMTLALVAVVAFLSTLIFTIHAVAAEEVNVPITANQAFDAVVQQIDPVTGENARIALIDVRTTAEYYWVGACGKVDNITSSSGTEYTPHNGKVVLRWGNFLCFRVESQYGLKPVYLPVSKVESLVTEDISIHIPTHIWDEANVTKYENPDFAATIESLSTDYDILILMCRSGKRSDTRAFDTSLFDTVYEIDDPDGKNGHGGFQGNSYGNVYNGYRGYPGRDTRSQYTQPFETVLEIDDSDDINGHGGFQGASYGHVHNGCLRFPGRHTQPQDTRSASWSDAGLPVHIGSNPRP
jgi:rhodanese-related sulfurtransferase